MVLTAPSFAASQPSVAASPRSPAEPPSAGGRSTFTEQITVLEVVLPVQVLRGGDPVRGLGSQNFEIWQAGRQLPLIGFEEVDLTLSGSGQAPAESRSEEGDDGSASLGSAELPSDRHFLALFDMAQSPANRLSLAVSSMRQMVANQLHPGDRVGVAVLGDGASLLAPLTRDRERVAAALDLVDAMLNRKRKEQAAARRRLAERPRDSLRELTAAVGPAAALALAGGDRLYGLSDPTLDLVLDSTLTPGFGGIGSGPLDEFAISRELESTSRLSGWRRQGRALSDLATLLGDVPGEKYLLYFSRGIPDFTSAVQEPLLGSGLLATYVDMVEALQRSGWILHALDVMGVGQGSPGSLFYLADESGGDLFDNYGHLEVATDRLVHRTSVSYRLIFQSPELQRDGRFHPVEVRLQDVPRGARVRGRQGYHAPKADRQRSPLERRLDEAQAIFTEPDREDFPARVLLLNTPKAASRERRLTLFVEVAGDELLEALPPASLDRRFALEVVAYAADGRLSRFDAGAVTDLLRDRFEFPQGRRAADLRSGFRFVGDLEVGTGEYEVRVRIKDPRSGAMFQTTRIAQGASPRADAAEGSLVAFFVATEDGGLKARESGSDALSSAASPLVFDGEVLLPAARARLVRGATHPLVVRLYGEGTAGARLVADLRSATDESLGELGGLWSEAMRRELDGSVIVATRLPSEALAPGFYRLLLSWLDDSGLRSAAGVEFEVVER